MTPLLDLRGIEKRFGGARALAGADLVLAPGSVHGLLGENGAGKSTLIKILSGLIAPDAGQILIEGQPVRIASVREAEARGFRFIHQELSLVPHFTAVENAFVGRRYPHRGPFIDRAAMRAAVAQVAARVAPDLPLDVPVARMTTGQRQMVEILRALMTGPEVPPVRLMVMDEPTASLSEAEAGRLHLAVARLREAGIATLYISHRLDEVQMLCDSFTVLRNGATLGAGDMVGIDRAGIVRLMSGRTAQPVQRRAPMPGPVVLTLQDLPFGPPGQRLDLDLRAGEVLGLYGLVGAGRSSLLKQIWGAEPHRGGQITLAGQRMRPGRIGARIAQGAAYVPEDRRHEGLIAARAIAENLVLPDLPAMRIARALPWMAKSRMTARAEGLRNRLGIRMGSVWDGPLTLSGGNQQKLLLGRWLGHPIRLLLLDEPSRGVDVGAKAEIHAQLRALAEAGAAVLMVTSDMDELLALSDRVMVMAQGRITAHLSGAEMTAGRIVDAAFDHTQTLTAKDAL